MIIMNFISTGLKALFYSVNLLPKKIIQGYVAETSLDNMTWFRTWFATAFRKVLFSLALVWAGKLVDAGLLDEGDKAKLAEFAIAAALMAGAAGWSKILLPLWLNRLWPLIQSKLQPAQSAGNDKV